MIFEVDELDFGRYSPAQLRAARPDLVRLADITRRNLRLLDSVLGVETERPDLRREIDRLRTELCEVYAQAEALIHDLATARAWVERLEARLAMMEADDEDDALYASVGLAPRAHEVVVRAARRALLSHMHPDRSPLRDKVSGDTTNCPPDDMRN